MNDFRNQSQHLNIVTSLASKVVNTDEVVKKDSNLTTNGVVKIETEYSETKHSQEDKNTRERQMADSIVHIQYGGSGGCSRIENGEKVKDLQPTNDTAKTKALDHNTCIVKPIPHHMNFYVLSDDDLPQNSVEDNTNYTSVVTNRKGEQPTTILKLDYPYFETTL